MIPMMSIETKDVGQNNKAERNYIWAKRIAKAFFYELLLIGIPAGSFFHCVPILILSMGGLVTSEFNVIHKQGVYYKSTTEQGKNP
jgi:hypothetical protein